MYIYKLNHVLRAVRRPYGLTTSRCIYSIYYYNIQ